MTRRTGPGRAAQRTERRALPVGAQPRGPHTWKMWYLMSLISIVLPLSPSCSDLLVIKVLNLEQRDQVGLEHGLIHCCANSTFIGAALGAGTLKMTVLFLNECLAGDVFYRPGRTAGASSVLSLPPLPTQWPEACGGVLDYSRILLCSDRQLQ